MDLAVIIRVRQRFGSSDDDTNMEQNAPFVGRSKQFAFNCPNIDSSSEAVLLFQAQHVMHSQNRLSINGTDIAGGVPMGGFFTGPPIGSPPTQDVPVIGFWSAQTLIVPPNTLRTEGNILEIDARTRDGSTSGDMPNFIVDNLVLFFRTRVARPILARIRSRRRE
jgi:hypothetical protein